MADAATGGILSRAIILILGIILFAVGLFTFKPTQTVIETGTSGAGFVGNTVRNAPTTIRTVKSIPSRIASHARDTAAAATETVAL